MTKNHKMNTIAVFFQTIHPLVPNCNSLSHPAAVDTFCLGAKVYGREISVASKVGLRYATMSTCWTAL